MLESCQDFTTMKSLNLKLVKLQHTMNKCLTQLTFCKYARKSIRFEV